MAVLAAQHKHGYNDLPFTLKKLPVIPGDV